MPPDRSRLLVLGTGFAAFRLVRSIDFGRYDVTVVSPRNHFVFTPLLASTTVGTVEFRSIIEPARHLGARFYQATCTGLDPALRRVTCRKEDVEFTLDYDRLVIAVGAVVSTFGIPGVAEHALFLKELQDARNIRQKVLACLESAALPGLSPEERARRVHFVVCGGGPTGVEFAAELHDLLFEEGRRYFPDLVSFAKITLVEAGPDILSTFDDKLRRYAAELFRRRIEVRARSPVVRVERDSLELQGGERLPFGLLVWSAGTGATEFVRGLPFQKDARGRLLTDHYFRVLDCADVYALGDCANLLGESLPATAQVAMKQGEYLAGALNRLAAGRAVPPFRYRNLGMLAYLGGNRALADLPNFKGAGWAAWLFWRSAYLTRLLTIRAKAQVLFDWIKSHLFERDISRF